MQLVRTRKGVRSVSRLKFLNALLVLLLLAACQAASSSRTSDSDPVPSTAADVPRLSVEELKAFLDAGQEAIVADARSWEAYDAGHVLGAISMPLSEVDERYQELPKDAKIVFYCT